MFTDQQSLIQQLYIYKQKIEMENEKFSETYTLKLKNTDLIDDSVMQSRGSPLPFWLTLHPKQQTRKAEIPWSSSQQCRLQDVAMATE